MDWAAYGEGNRNPVVTVGDCGGLDIVHVSAAAGQTVALDASPSYDPDGDGMVFRWWTMPEAGTYGGDVAISDPDSAVAEAVIPADASGKTIHIICEVHDDGTPVLTSYRRVVVEVR